MRALYNVRHGGPEVLEVREMPDPIPGPGEVTLAVHRAGLNFADVSARVGLYPDAPRTPMVMGYEVSGTVQAVGAEVEGLEPGMRALAVPHFGGQASCVKVGARLVRRIPDALDFDAAAAMPVNYLTAYHLLFIVGRLRPGMRVLLHMAAGGVGFAVIELCKRVEGVEIFGTASERKHEMLREAGVAHPIDYHTQDYAKEVRRITSGHGVDLVLDPLGGPDWHKGYGLLAPSGQLIAYGWSNMVKGTSRNLGRVATQFLSVHRYSPYRLMDENKTVSGVNMGHLWDQQVIVDEMDELLKLSAEGHLHPKVDRVFPLAQAAEAHRYMQEGKNVGKVLFDCT